MSTLARKAKLAADALSRRSQQTLSAAANGREDTPESVGCPLPDRGDGVAGIRTCLNSSDRTR